MSRAAAFMLSALLLVSAVSAKPLAAETINGDRYLEAGYDEPLEGRTVRKEEADGKEAVLPVFLAPGEGENQPAPFSQGDSPVLLLEDETETVPVSQSAQDSGAEPDAPEMETEVFEEEYLEEIITSEDPDSYVSPDFQPDGGEGDAQILVEEETSEYQDYYEEVPPPEEPAGGETESPDSPEGAEAGDPGMTGGEAEASGQERAAEAGDLETDRPETDQEALVPENGGDGGSLETGQKAEPVSDGTHVYTEVPGQAAGEEESAEENGSFTGGADPDLISGETQEEAAGVDQRAVLTGMSLSLTDRVVMNVYVQSDGTVGDDDYMEFTCDGETVREAAEDAGQNQMTLPGGRVVDVLVFEYPLNMRQMTDDVSFHMVVDGQAGSTLTRTVRSYADQVLASSCPEDRKNVTRAMLNCGACAQYYFGYKTDMPANDGIFAEGADPVRDGPDPDMTPFAYRIEQSAGKFGFRISEASLELKEDISLILYYETDLDWGSWLYRITLANSDKTPERGYDPERQKNYVKIPHIMPYELAQSFTIEVTAPSLFQTRTVARLDYSPMSYCREILSDASSSEEARNLCRSLYYYWEASESVRNSLFSGHGSR